MDLIQWCSLYKQAHLAKRLSFTLKHSLFQIKGDNMQFTMPVGFAVPFSVSPIDSLNNPSSATLSGISFSSSDTTIIAVGADPTNPANGTMTSLAAGTATLSGTATATEADGTTHQVQGAVTVTIAAVPPPATALLFSFGTPAPVSSTPPPPPPPPPAG